MELDATKISGVKRYGKILIPLVSILFGAITIAGYSNNDFSHTIGEKQRLSLSIHEDISSTSMFESTSAKLDIIKTSALYLDDFKAPDFLSDTWHQARSLINMHQDSPVAVADSSNEKASVASLLGLVALVKTAHAAIPDISPAKKDDDKKPINAWSSKSKQKDARGNSDSSERSYLPGTLGHMVQLQSVLEQLRIEVEIEETRSRLNKLRKSEVVDGSPDRSRPSLEFPPLGMLKSIMEKPFRIVSIQSINGRYTAIVSTDSGSRGVKVNDVVSGRRVVSINRNTVVVNRGQGNETLTVQD